MERGSSSPAAAAQLDNGIHWQCLGQLCAGSVSVLLRWEGEPHLSVCPAVLRPASPIQQPGTLSQDTFLCRTESFALVLVTSRGCGLGVGWGPAGGTKPAESLGVLLGVPGPVVDAESHGCLQSLPNTARHCVSLCIQLPRR